MKLYVLQVQEQEIVWRRLETRLKMSCQIWTCAAFLKSAGPYNCYTYMYIHGQVDGDELYL